MLCCVCGVEDDDGICFLAEADEVAVVHDEVAVTERGTAFADHHKLGFYFADGALHHFYRCELTLLDHNTLSRPTSRFKEISLSTEEGRNL